MKFRSVEILVAALVLFVCTSPVLATIHFKDGGIHDIDYEINDDVWVDYESPGLETTLNILDVVIMPYPYHVRGCQDSIINILGGSMSELYATDSSQVTVSGGSMGTLYAFDSSQVTVSGGSMSILRAYETSQVAVSGGLVGYYFDAYDNSQVTVSGGSMDRLHAYDSSQVTLSGGSINEYLVAYGSSQVDVSGGSMDWLVASDSSQVAVSGGLIGGGLLVSDNAILTIHGWDFAVDGTPVGYTELYSIFGGSYQDEPYRQLAGTLLSGDPINNQFRIGELGKIALVPEPTTILLLGLGGLTSLCKRRS